MRNRQKDKTEITRRDLLKLTAEAAALAGLAGIPSTVLLAPAAAGGPEDISLPIILKNGLPCIEGNDFWRALRQDPGSSFQLGEEHVNRYVFDMEPMGSGWHHLQLVQDETKDTGLQVTTREMTYENGKGLRVKRVFTFYKEFQAAEYKTYFENIGSADLPSLSKVFPIDLWFPFSAFERLVLHTMDAHTELLKGAGGGMPHSGITLSTGNEFGDGNAPMALMEDHQSGEGMFLELGWAGYWQIMFRWVDFKKTPFPLPQTWGGKITDTLQIFGGIPDLQISLRPGEKISSPAVLLGFYSGGVRQGSNQLRRLKLEHFRPPWPADVPESPVYYDDFYLSTATVTENYFKNLADRAAELGAEYFGIGMDWIPERQWARYQPYVSPGEPWIFPVDPEIFPSRSLRPFSDYIHSKGMKLGLWFEAPHVESHWPVVQEHPEWLWPMPSGPTSQTSYRTHQINLANPEALKWCQDQMARAIREWNVDLILNDRMFGPAAPDLWKGFDPPGQKGVTQIKYIEARYALYEWLQAQFPHLLIFHTQSRDFETGRRTNLAYGTVAPGDGNDARSASTKLNCFYPAVDNLNDFISYKDSYEEPYPLSAWLSRFAGSLGLGDAIGFWSPATFAQGKRVIEVYKSIRHLLKGDFYPLFDPRLESLETWDGWQFHDPGSGEGFAVAFRLRYCEQSTATVHFQGLRETASFRFEDPFSGGRFTMTGRELARKGLAVSLPKNGAQLLHYTVLG